MEFKFELGEPILYQLSILDKVLGDLGQPSVFENSDFIINKDSACTFGLDIKIFQSSRKTIPIYFFLEGHSMRIDIEDIPETFEWIIKDMKKSDFDVISFIKQLLTSYVLMEYFGSHTAMSLFDSEGVRIKRYTLRYYISIKSLFKKDSKQILFFPIYPI